MFSKAGPMVRIFPNPDGDARGVGSFPAVGETKRDVTRS
jgi:hypothetical protein